jgi:hypothetical protein
MLPKIVDLDNDEIESITQGPDMSMQGVPPEAMGVPA